MGRIKRAAVGDAKSRMFALLAGLAVGLVCVGVNMSADAQSGKKGRPATFNPGKHCTLPPHQAPDLDGMDSGTVSRAAKCSDPERSTTPEKLSYAQFQAAKAKRIQAESNPAQNQKLLEEAQKGFNAAKGINNNLETDAGLELARVYRLQGNFDDAEKELKDLGSGSSGVLYERAMVVIERARRAAIDRPTASSATPDPQSQSMISALNDLRSLRAGADFGDAYVMYRGPYEFAKLSNAMGEATLKATTTTTSSVQQAAGQFSEASGAIERALDQARLNRDAEWEAKFTALAPQVYFNLGRAKLRIASRARDPDADDSDCQATEPTRDIAVTQPLSEAKESFSRASAKGDGLWGLGCVMAANGEFAAAADNFQKAVNDPSSPSQLGPWEAQLALARVQAENNQEAAAIQNYRNALKAPSLPPKTALKMRMELSRHLSANEALAEIFKVLRPDGRPAADPYNPKLDPVTSQNADAYIERALIWIPSLDNRERRTARGASTGVKADPDQKIDLVGVSPEKVVWTRMNLSAAGNLPGDNAAWAAYMLSRLEFADGKSYAAVLAADAAANADNSPRYQRQACLMRIQAWKVLTPALRQKGETYCASGSGEDYDVAEQYLFLGMYHLRSTSTYGGGAQVRAWSDALKAFTLGVKRLGKADDRRSNILRARLARGQNDALYCNGFRSSVDDIATSRGSPEEANNANMFFAEYGLAQCEDRRP
jgi:hypothetical protein